MRSVLNEHAKRLHLLLIFANLCFHLNHCKPQQSLPTIKLLITRQKVFNDTQTITQAIKNRLADTICGLTDDFVANVFFLQENSSCHGRKNL
jgi:hypothetical protein